MFFLFLRKKKSFYKFIKWIKLKKMKSRIVAFPFKRCMYDSAFALVGPNTNEIVTFNIYNVNQK